jgi:hypothetical protein
MPDHALVEFLAQNGLLRSLIDQSPLMAMMLDGGGDWVRYREILETMFRDPDMQAALK